MKRCFTKPQWLLLLLPSLMLLMSSRVQAQDGGRTVRGRVTDASSGEPIAGVTIRVTGTNKVSVSQRTGDYAVQVQSGDQLAFSALGYESQQVNPAGLSRVDIQLVVASAMLDDVVVVGYGTQKKANLTGSVSTVGAKQIENRPVTNLATALQGTAAGLIVTRTSGQPGAEDIAVQIRGVTSANGNVNPLVILDGVVANTGVLQTINPSDVESVTVLKDAAVASIYGAQAAGGVMLITTKKGAEGKAKFNYSNHFSQQQAMNVPQKLSLLEEMAYLNKARSAWNGGPAYYGQDFYRTLLGVEHYINPNDTTQWVYYNTVDQAQLVLKDHTSMSNHNFSVSGGNAKTNYLLSLGLFDQNGIFKVGPDKFQRYNARMNVGAKITEKLSFDGRVGFSVSDILQPTITANGTFSSSLLNMLYRFRNRYPFLTPNGQYNNDSGAAATTYARLDGGGYSQQYRRNLDAVFSLTREDVFTEGLDVKMTYGGQYYNWNQSVLIKTIQLWSNGVKGTTLNPTNSANRNHSNDWNSNLHLVANYDKTIGLDHQIGGLIGYQWNSYRNEALWAGASNLSSNELASLNLGDVATKTNSDGVTTVAYQSYFGRLNYAFKNRYLVEATLRGDESSRLAPGSRLKWFPSASIGWKIQEESFFKPIAPVVSEFKLRASWGTLGSAEGSIIGTYSYLDQLGTGNNVILGSAEARNAYYFNSAIPSATLTWETLESKNIGVDLGFLKNKLNLNFDYYVKHNNNMLVPQQLPVVLGIATPRVNEGRLKSWGWELQVSYVDQSTNGMSWGTSFNLSDNKNELLKYNDNFSVWSGTVGLLEGYPMNSLWGYRTNGYIQNEQELAEVPFYHSETNVGHVKYVDLNRNGVLDAGRGTLENHGDLVYYGTNQPRYTFGWTGDFAWKGFDLRVFLQGVFKRSFFADMSAVHPGTGSWLQPIQMHMDFWTEENRNAAFPRAYGTSSFDFIPSDKWLMNGAYVRLKNIQLGYTVPKQFVQRIRLENVRVFFTGQDLYTWDKLGIFSSTFNPEAINNVGHHYPMFATYAFGVNVSF